MLAAAFLGYGGVRTSSDTLRTQLALDQEAAGLSGETAGQQLSPEGRLLRCATVWLSSAEPEVKPPFRLTSAYAQ